MSRLTFLAVLLGGAVAAAASHSAPPPAGPPAVAGKAPAVPHAAPVLALSRVVDFTGFEDPKTTFQEALERLAKVYGVSIDVNARAFSLAGLPPDALNKAEIANPPISPMRARLSRVLQAVLDRVTVPTGAVYMVREDGIEVTTVDARNAEVPTERDEVAPARPPLPGQPGSSKTGDVSAPLTASLIDEESRKIRVPVVSVALKGQPFAEAVEQIRAQTNVNLVLDPALKEKAAVPLTITLINAPLDSAALILTELADLDFVWLDNVFLVTTAEKAARLRAKWPNRRGGSTLLPGAGGMG